MLGRHKGVHPLEKWCLALSGSCIAKTTPTTTRRQAAQCAGSVYASCSSSSSAFSQTSGILILDIRKHATNKLDLTTDPDLCEDDLQVLASCVE